MTINLYEVEDINPKTSSPYDWIKVVVSTTAKWHEIPKMNFLN